MRRFLQGLLLFILGAGVAVGAYILYGPAEDSVVRRVVENIEHPIASVIPPAHVTPVIESYRDDTAHHWNTLLLYTIASERVAPPASARALAMLNVAMFHAANAAEGKYETLYDTATPPENYDPEIGTVAAAAYMMDVLFPRFDDLWMIEEQLGMGRDTEKDTVYVTSKQYGVRVAQQVFQERVRDGANDFARYQPEDIAGAWAPTPPYFEEAMLPLYAQMPTFVLRSADQFLPAPPPGIDSEVFAEELAAIMTIGDKDSPDRTDEQSDIARLWADGKGTYTPPGTWNLIALQQLEATEWNLVEKTRTMALLNLALADAGVSCWNAKYHYAYWRPIQAINAEKGLEYGDAGFWESYLENPNFPEYTSGHSTFSGAAATILGALFPAPVEFEVVSLGAPGVVRSFTDFDTAAEEAAMSRIYGGIHFQSAADVGVEQGQQVARYVLAQALKPAQKQLWKAQ